MNEIDLLLAQNKDFTFIEVKFTSGTNPKGYHYKTTEKFEVDDKAVVNVNNELKIVEVVAVDCILNLSSHIKYKWAVQKVDFTEYDRCQTVEKELQTQLNSLRLSKLRNNLETELIAEIGDDGVKKLIRL